MAKYKLSDGRIVHVPDGDMAYQTFQKKLKQKNLTAELITEEPESITPGKQEGPTSEAVVEAAATVTPPVGQNQEADQSPNNQQNNTGSESEDTSLESQSKGTVEVPVLNPEEIDKQKREEAIEKLSGIFGTSFNAEGMSTEDLLWKVDNPFTTKTDLNDGSTITTDISPKGETVVEKDGEIIKKEDYSDEVKEVIHKTPLYKPSNLENEKQQENSITDQELKEKEINNDYREEVLDNLDIGNFDATDENFWRSETPQDMIDKLVTGGFDEELFGYVPHDDGTVTIWKKGMTTVPGTSMDVPTPENSINIRTNIRLEDEYKKYTTGVGKKFSTDMKFKKDHLNQAIDEQSNILYTFLNQNLSNEDKNNIEVKQDQIIEDFKSKKELILSNESKLEIEEKYNDPTLFDVVTETRQTTGSRIASVALAPFTLGGSLLVEDGIGPTTEVEVQPYEEELNEAKNLLINKGIENPTIEQIQNLARTFLINKEKEKLIKNNVSDLVNSDDIEGEAWFGNGQALTLNAFQMASGLTDREQAKDIIEATYNKIHKDKEVLPIVTNLRKDIDTFRANAADPNYQFEIEEGEETVTLANDKVVPKSLYDQYETNVCQLDNEINVYDSWLNENNKVYENIDENTPFINNLIQRNFNDGQGFWKKLGLSGEKLYWGTAHGGNQLIKTSVGLSDDSAYGQLLFQRKKNFDEAINMEKSYLEAPVAFDDAFDNPVNFFKFAANATAENTLQFAALVLPGGALAVGTSSGGDQYAIMSQKEELNPSEQRSQLKKTAIGLLWGAAEFLPDVLITQANFLRAAKGMNLTGSILNEGMSGYSRFLQNAAFNTFSYTASEAIAEGGTGIMQNALIGKPITDGLLENMFVGGMFGLTLSTVPTASSLVMNEFTPRETTAQFRENLVKLENIDNSIAEHKIKRSRKKWIEDGVENPTSKQIIDEINTNTEFNNDPVVKELFNQQQDIRGENETILTEQMNKMQNLSKEFTGAYLHHATVREDIKRRAKKINNDKSIDSKTKKELLKNLQNQADANNRVLDDLNNPEVFGDKFVGFLNSNKSNDIDRKNNLLKDAKSELIGEGKENPSDTQIRERAKILYNTQEINNDFKTKRGKTKLGKSLKNFQTIKDATDAINNIENISDKAKETLIQEVENGAHGANVRTTDGQFIPFQVVENMAKDSRLETRTHELGHTILSEAISGNPEAFNDVANDILAYVNKTNPALYTKLKLRTEGMPADEVVTNFMEMVASGEINLKDKKNGILGGWAANMLGLGVKKATNSDVEFNFEGETDAVTFVSQLAKKIKNGDLTLKQREAIKRGQIAKEARKKIDPKKDIDEVKLSRDAKPVVDELGRMGWTPKTWKDKGANFAIKEMKDNKMLDGLIASKLKVKMDPVNTQDFINKVYAELTTHTKNFNPDVNDSLFGWINSQISNKAGNVYNREYKTKQRTQDIDAVTAEGRPIIQLEADTRAEQDFIDNIGLEKREQSSKLRKDLGLNEDMINKVRQAVIKTFGTRLPNVSSKKFRNELEKRFRTELKKPIQDMIGSRANYDIFLENNFEVVYDALPVETLIQMERTVKPEQRIFTESQRITKSKEVDRLISEGLLPKDTNRLSGPQLHTKKKYPRTKKVMAFFRGTNMSKELGYEVGSSTLGTRKDKLAMEIGVELAFDATMDVVQQPDIIEKRKNILELDGREILDNDIAMIAKQIDRDPSIKFSKTGVSAKNGDIVVDQAMNLIDKLNNAKKIEDVYSLKYDKGWKVKPKVGKYLEQVQDLVFKHWMNGNIIMGDYQSKNAVVKILKGIPRNIIKENTGTAVERSAINLGLQAEKKYSDFRMKTREVAEGGIPDFHSDLMRMFPFNIEVKFDNARLPQIPVEVVDFKTGKFKIKYEGKYKDKVKKAIESALKNGGENLVNKLAELGIPLESSKSKVPSFVHKEVSGIDVGKVADVSDTVDEGYAIEAYGKKEIPSDIIEVVGAGAYYLTDPYGIAAELGIPKLKGNFPLKVRIKSTSYKENKQTAGYKYPMTVEPTISPEYISEPSPISMYDSDFFDKVMNSRAVANLKAKQKVNEINTIKKAFNNQIKYSKTGKAKGMSTFDFDDTLAKTKSGVRATVLNTDGKPKPKRKVVFLAGGAGSGKGNVVKKLGLEKDGFKIVNQDISLEWLKKNNGLPENMNELTKEQRSVLGKLGHQARGIAKRKMMKYQGNADGVVVDGTGGSVKQMQKLVDEFKSKGYDVSMMFVETSLDVALKRNKARKERSLLDIIIKKNHETVQNNKPNFKKMFSDRFMEVDTDNLKQGDPMPAELINNMDDFVTGYEKLRLDAEQFAAEGDKILQRGGEFDFSEFNDVVDGTPGPLLDKAKQRAEKYGTKDMFVLTARPQASAPAIQQFLKSQGLDIPIKNITGLANSTGNAKAEWMLEKFAEGYNDMYFVDDALANVEAVKNALNQLDIKSDVVQAKIKFSKNASKDFNEMLERQKGVKAKKEFSYAEARKRGSKFDFKRFMKNLYIPPSAEDFKGLMYSFLGKGKQGDADMKFFADNLFTPFAKGIRAWNAHKQNMVNDYKALKKQFPKVKLNNKVKGTVFTNDTAIRVYLWNKSGFDVPGISKKLQRQLLDHVNKNPDLKNFADGLSNVTKRTDGYVKPSENWMMETIPSDLRNIVDKVSRKEFLQEWIDNKDIIFNPENLNKIEVVYGTGFRDALENILFRMENGGNRLQGKDKTVNRFTEWINGSVGAIMFFNMRSALLQTISTVNFVNWSDNNIFKASKAFANQPQFWKDFAMLYNSDQLKQRRKGLQTDVSASELTKSFAEGGYNPRTVINWLLQKGFTPTQVADSFAIAFGGASFYRNRLNKYKKQGMSDAKAKKRTMLEFQEIAEETQQSSREDLVSKQQAGPLGRIILAFQNVTMQYGRLTKKSLSDLINGRGDAKTNISKIIYYGMAQNIIFAALQTGIMWLALGDQEEEIEKKTTRAANQALDSFLRGTGLYGAFISTIKNTAIQWHLQSQKGYGRSDASKIALEAINLSPPIGSKVRKIVSAYKTLQYNKGISDKLTYRIENPKLNAAASVIEAVTNIPLARVLNKANNLEEALTGDHLWWQRTAMTLGWNRWDLGVKDEEIETAKEEVKEEKKQIKEEKKKKKKEEEKIIKEEEKKKEEKRKEEEGIKTVRCSGKNSSGQRCGNTTETKKKKWKCPHHSAFIEGSDRDGDGLKEYRCTASKTNGRRCKNKTENTNKKCYAHQ